MAASAGQIFVFNKLLINYLSFFVDVIMVLIFKDFSCHAYSSLLCGA